MTRLYGYLIYTHCRVKGLTPDDAADTVQDVFVKVHRSLPRFRRETDEDSFRRWLRTILVNTITDHFRKLGKQPAVISSESLIQFLAVEPPDRDGADGQTVDAIATEMLRQLLDLFEPDYAVHTWQAFKQTTLSGRSAKDVADDLGMSEGAVRQAKHRILRRLRKEMSVFDEDA